MRPFLSVLLLAGLAAAAPTVRWINRFGDARNEEITEVVAESGTEITVRLREGNTKTIPVRRLIEFAREEEKQADLLAARRHVAAGIRLDEARPVLDRYAAKGEPAWTREYAAAARALLAARAGEKDAWERSERFLSDYPKSRFRAAIHVARARLRAPETKDLMAMKKLYWDAYDRIDAEGGPVSVAGDGLVDATIRSFKRDTEDLAVIGRIYTRMLDIAKEKGDDLLYVALAEVAFARIELGFQTWIADRVIAQGEKPAGQRREIEALIRRTRFLATHAELQSDLRAEAGRLAEACGDTEGARAAWKDARTFAAKLPDPTRRDAIDRNLARTRE